MNKIADISQIPNAFICFLIIGRYEMGPKMWLYATVTELCPNITQ